MASFHEILLRGQQTVGVWEYFAPTLAFGTLTLAPYKTDVEALPAANQAVTDAEAVQDEPRDLRDAKLALIREIATRLPRLAAESLAPEDSLQDDIASLQRIVMQGEEAILERGRATKTLWTGVNARRAAATPALPALTLLKPGGGSWAVADLTAALAAVATLEQDVKDSAAPLSAARSARRTLATRVDRASKRWYAAWDAHFPVGTPEHDALSQITTEGGGTGEAGEGEPPEPSPEPPGPPQNVGLIPGAVGSGELGAGCDVPEGATGLKIWREVFGNPPTLLATLTDVTALPHVLTFTPGENVAIFMTATNAGGEGEPSTTVSATAP